MDPTGKPQESKGTATRKAIMDGRFFIAEHSGKFQMPGADGKMKDMNFKGMAIEGYDNVKKKFVSSWIDSMGTMIMNSEGTYDAAAKTFTYTAECEMMPGMAVRIRETIKVIDKDHHPSSGTRIAARAKPRPWRSPTPEAGKNRATSRFKQSPPAVGRSRDRRRAFCFQDSSPRFRQPQTLLPNSYFLILTFFRPRP